MLKGRKVIDIAREDGNAFMIPQMHNFLKAENAFKLHDSPPPEAPGMRGLWL